jgi:hypothetical protein
MGDAYNGTEKVDVMRTTMTFLGSLAAVVLGVTPAMAQVPQTPADQPPIAQAENSPQWQYPQPEASPQVATANPQTLQPEGQHGQWVQTQDSGWIWVPEQSTTYAVDGVPYVYLYTPAYGWTWYASPWGWGPYAYGPWVTHPWPFGFRAWAYGPTGWGWRAGYWNGGRFYGGAWRGGAGGYGGHGYGGGGFGGHYSGGGRGGGGGGHGGGHR